MILRVNFRCSEIKDVPQSSDEEKMVLSSVRLSVE